MSFETQRALSETCTLSLKVMIPGLLCIQYKSEHVAMRLLRALIRLLMWDDQHTFSVSETLMWPVDLQSGTLFLYPLTLPFFA